MSAQRSFWLVQIALWAGFALLTRFTWIDVHPPTWWWIAIYMTLGLLISSALAWCYEQLREKPRVMQILVSLLFSVLLGLLWRTTFNAIEYHVLESANNQFKFWGYFHNGKSAIMQLLIWSGGYWLLHYHQNLNQLQVQQQQLALEAKEANLKMLRYQITPHFLFNVLSSLDTLILKRDTGNARLMLQKLSDYLRQTLANESKPTQSLSAEIAQCQRYLEIEQLRFKEKLNIEWQMPEEDIDWQVPGGILLPLFENALKHGSLKTGDPTLISFRLVQQDNKIHLYLSNSLSTESNQVEGFGIGLKNTEQRLLRFFGDKVRFSAGPNNNEFKVKIAFTL